MITKILKFVTVIIISGSLTIAIAGCQSLSLFQSSDSLVCPTCNARVDHEDKAGELDNMIAGIQPIDVITTKCPSCKTTTEVGRESIGKIHVCSNCGSKVSECSRCLRKSK